MEPIFAMYTIKNNKIEPNYSILSKHIKNIHISIIIINTFYPTWIIKKVGCCINDKLKIIIKINKISLC